MKVHAFDSIDSTSTHAARLLEDKEAAPFAVIAKTQTAGRGRSGRQWESPTGGLYLTLVLPPESHPDPQHPGSLPLWVASQTAAFIQQKYSLRLTIKWPNDLLFAGRKLAGILCESRMHGKELGPMIIGIGINLHDAPAVAEQESIALESILQRPLEEDALAIGEQLADYLRRAAELTRGGTGGAELMRGGTGGAEILRGGTGGNAPTHSADWRKTYDSFAIENGQLYTDGSKQASLYGVTKDGNLQIIDCQSKELQSLSSVSHGYRWAYQLNNPLLVADIGNSLVKIAYFADSSSTESQICRLDLRDETFALQLASFLESLSCPKPWIVHGITVASRPWEKLSEALRPHELTLVPVPKRPLRVNYSAYNFAQLGIDRVALAEAARQKYPGDELLVLSAGTCITIEAVSKEGAYLGGYILPGLQTKLNSLHLRTDRLPLLKIYEEDTSQLKLFGRNTKDAMLSGLIHESIAMIEYLDRQMAKKPRLILTGGDAKILAPHLSHEYHEALTLEGVRLMAKGGALC